MIFKCLDGAFCRIDTVIVWFDELDGSIVLLHECLYWGCSLIVGDIENGLETFVGEHLMDLCECC